MRSQHFPGKGLVPSGNKPLPEPVLAKICSAQGKRGAILIHSGTNIANMFP